MCVCGFSNPEGATVCSNCGASLSNSYSGPPSFQTPANSYGAPASSYPTNAPYNNYYPVMQSSSNSFAIASLVSSLVGFLCGFGAILGIIFGFIGLSKAKETGQGKTMSIVGLSLGFLEVFLMSIVFAVLINS